MPDLTADYAVASAAAEAKIQTEIKAFVPAMFQSRIPAAAVHSMAAEVGKAVVDALVAAHAAQGAAQS